MSLGRCSCGYRWLTLVLLMRRWHVSRIQAKVYKPRETPSMYAMIQAIGMRRWRVGSSLDPEQSRRCSVHRGSILAQFHHLLLVISYWSGVALHALHVRVVKEYSSPNYRPSPSTWTWAQCRSCSLTAAEFIRVWACDRQHIPYRYSTASDMLELAPHIHTCDMNNPAFHLA